MNERHPEVQDFRIKNLEGKVDGLHQKMDAMSTLIVGLQVSSNTERLVRLVEEHDKAIIEIRTDITVAKAGARALMALAVMLGSILGAGASIVANRVWPENNEVRTK